MKIVTKIEYVKKRRLFWFIKNIYKIFASGQHRGKFINNWITHIMKNTILLWQIYPVRIPSVVLIFQSPQQSWLCRGCNSDYHISIETLCLWSNQLHSEINTLTITARKLYYTCYKYSFCYSFRLATIIYKLPTCCFNFVLCLHA